MLALTLAAVVASPAQAAPWTPPTTGVADNPDFEAVSGDAPAPPHVSAKTAILVDPESGRILFSRKANDRVPMASTAKIMTALVVLEHLPLDAEVTASQKAVDTIGSRVGLQVGESLTVEQLLYALLVRSANDAAVALAEGVAGSVADFVDLMNEKAAALGLEEHPLSQPAWHEHQRELLLGPRSGHDHRRRL